MGTEISEPMSLESNSEAGFVNGRSVRRQSETKWIATAPSNIALIKYMGKTDAMGNRPSNVSVSYTLSHLKSWVELEYVPSMEEDGWEPLRQYGARKFEALRLSVKGLARFISHLQVLKKAFEFQGAFVIRSANDFPSDCGLASSASSFAALTKAALLGLSDLTGRETVAGGVGGVALSEAAAWSRKGSGSSCRSFFAPWALWSQDRVSEVRELKSLGELVHQVVVVDDDIKSVSSSEAHRRVTSSLLFAGRADRAEIRAQELIAALRDDRWEKAFEITWAEFWDMHALFETSQPSFAYMTPGSLEVLRFVRGKFWDKHDRGPLVTMDAGPNIHLLYRPDHEGRAMAAEVMKTFAPRFKVISNLSIASR